MATVAEIEARLSAYRSTELRILEGGQESEHSSGVDGRRTVRAGLAQVQAMIKQLEQDLAAAQARENGSGRSRNLSPLW
jgi:hypothetical protein